MLLTLCGLHRCALALMLSLCAGCVQSLTLFLPGRFQEGGALHSEALYTSLNLLSVFHDALLDQPRALTAEIKMDPRGKTAAWAHVAQSILLTAHYTEVLVEMAAKKYLPASPLLPAGSQSRRSWLVLCAVEALKAYCRLSLLYVNRGRMLTPPSNEEMILDHMSNIRAKQKNECKARERNEYELACKQAAEGEPAQQLLLANVSVSSPSESSSTTLLLASAATPQCDTSLLPIPADALPPNSSFSPFSLRPGHLPPLQVQNLLDLYVRAGRQQAMDSTLGRPHGRFVTQTAHPHDSPSYVPPPSEVVSEVLHLIRPIVYTAARAAWDQEPNSWKPWILSVAVDAASKALAPRSGIARACTDPQCYTCALFRLCCVGCRIVSDSFSALCCVCALCSDCRPCRRVS